MLHTCTPHAPHCCRVVLLVVVCVGAELLRVRVRARVQDVARLRRSASLCDSAAGAGLLHNIRRSVSARPPKEGGPGPGLPAGLRPKSAAFG